MGKKPYYAVANGRTIGVFTSWSSSLSPILSSSLFLIVMLTCLGTTVGLPWRDSQAMYTRDSTAKLKQRVILLGTSLQTSQRRNRKKSQLRRKQMHGNLCKRIH